jgi:uncharacterized membrane protein (DUF373 family)
MRLAARSLISRVCFAIAVMLFILGMFILCACPGWYVCASLFACLATAFARDVVKVWGMILLFACIAMAMFHLFAKVHEKKQIQVRKLKAEQPATEKARNFNRSKTNSP